MQDAFVAMLTSRLDTIDRSISEEKRDSAESRRRVYAKLEEQDKKVEAILRRLSDLEQVTSSMSPTVAEYIEYKSQVKGAGKLGKFLWTLGGYILTIAATAASSWAWAKGYFSSLIDK